MKKFFAILMVAVMVLSLSTVAFAAGFVNSSMVYDKYDQEKVTGATVEEIEEGAKDALNEVENLESVEGMPSNYKNLTVSDAFSLTGSNSATIEVPANFVALMKYVEGEWVVVATKADVLSGKVNLDSEDLANGNFAFVTGNKKSNNNGGGSSSEPTSPQTGEMMPVVAMVGAVSFAAAAAYTLRKAKRA